MRTVISLAGAFLAALLLLAIVNLYSSDQDLLELPLLVIFFAVMGVGFGYATIEANLKKKIVAVIIIEGIALTATAAFYLITRGYNQKDIFWLSVGISTIVILLVFREKK